MGIAGRQKDSYCSNKCQAEADGNGGGGSKGSGKKGFWDEPETTAEDIELERLEKEEERLKREEKQAEKLRLEGKVAEVASMQFGDTAESISATLDQLVTIAASKPGNPVKKAIYEKMEFAIMKLRQLGANAEADFFEKKRAGIKPKIFGLF